MPGTFFSLVRKHVRAPVRFQGMPNPGTKRYWTSDCLFHLFLKCGYSACRRGNECNQSKERMYFFSTVTCFHILEGFLAGEIKKAPRMMVCHTRGVISVGTSCPPQGVLTTPRPPNIRRTFSPEPPALAPTNGIPTLGDRAGIQTGTRQT
jgi:hypothetical protein